MLPELINTDSTARTSTPTFASQDPDILDIAMENDDVQDRHIPGAHLLDSPCPLPRYSWISSGGWKSTTFKFATCA